MDAGGKSHKSCLEKRLVCLVFIYTPTVEIVINKAVLLLPHQSGTTDRMRMHLSHLLEGLILQIEWNYEKSIFEKSQFIISMVHTIADNFQVYNLKIPSGQTAARGCGAHQAAAGARPPNRPRAASTGGTAPGMKDPSIRQSVFHIWR